MSWFGWYSRVEYQLLETQLLSWRERAIAAETTVELVKEILTREQKAREKLEETLFQARPQESAPEMKPVGNTLSSWPRIRREMEKMHRANEGTPTKGEVESSM